MWVAFTIAKATHIVFSKKKKKKKKNSIYAMFSDQRFNDTLHVTDDIVSFEQLGPGVYPDLTLFYMWLLITI